MNSCIWVTHFSYDVETGLCKQAPMTQAPLNAGTLDPQTQGPQKPPLIFIPNIKIPGLFGGPIEIGSDSIGKYIAAFYMFFVSMVGVLAVAMVVYGGYRRITSAGNASHIQESNEIINSALAGILLTFLSYLLINLINPTLTKLAGFELKKVEFISMTIESQEGTDKTSGLGDVEINVSTGELISIKNVTSDYDDVLLEAATNNGIPQYVAILKAIMHTESGGNPNAFSDAGACGLMQIMPINLHQSDCTGFRTLPVKPTDPDSVKAEKIAIIKRNADNGARLFAGFLKNTCPTSATLKSGKTVTCTPSETKCTNGNPWYAIPAYNGGQKANCSSTSCPGKTWWECPANWDKTNPRSYLQTANYVLRVKGAYAFIIQNSLVPK
ncbi:MAG: transglycosylase SLT domain-containing protein [Sideroxyarcus sp.]|nr:transglycosylase SLT domain-containing protein [Sideroxyarcus sp.]